MVFELMIYENFKNLTTDRTIRAVIGVNRETFDSLVTHFSDSYHKIQQERYENKEINHYGLKSIVWFAAESRVLAKANWKHWLEVTLLRLKVGASAEADLSQWLIVIPREIHHHYDSGAYHDDQDTLESFHLLHDQH